MRGPSSIRRPRRRPSFSAPDAFAPCAWAWAHNTLVSLGASAVSEGVARGIDDSKALRNLMGEREEAADAREASRRVRRYLARHGQRTLRVPEPSEPVRSSLRTIGHTLGLDAFDRAVLAFALGRERSPMLQELCDALGSLAPMGRYATSVALGVPMPRVVEATGPRSRLMHTGLVRRDDSLYAATGLMVSQRLPDLVFAPLDREQLLRHYLDEAPAPQLRISDFERMAGEVRLAERLLSRALETRRRGVNLLLVGPTGTGKTELSRVLARQLGVPLYVAGLADEEGLDASPRERLSSLLLGHRLLGRTPALMLLDELEDVFSFPLLAGRPGSLLSKQWFNALLENNQVPTIWIGNDVDALDPAFLRRFTYTIRVPTLRPKDRAQVLRRHLGRRRSGLTAIEIDDVAARFPAQPAQLASAVATARLLSEGGKVTRPALEQVLAPSVELLTGRDPRRRVHGAFDPKRYNLDAACASEDLGLLADRLASWTPDCGSVSLCLYGPPGTGKSAFVRYLAWRMGRPVVARRGSDLLHAFVGQTEQAIAAAFREAEDTGAVLLLDEVDALLRDRRSAHMGWEVSMVDEVLQQLEAFGGVVACTTNLWEEIDRAALRRFVFKVEMRPLDAVHAVVQLAGMLGRELSDDEGTRVARVLGRLARVTAGDLAASERHLLALGQELDLDCLLKQLGRDLSSATHMARTVGFLR